MSDAMLSVEETSDCSSRDTPALQHCVDATTAATINASQTPTTHVHLAEAGSQTHLVSPRRNLADLQLLLACAAFIGDGLERVTVRQLDVFEKASLPSSTSAQALFFMDVTFDDDEDAAKATWVFQHTHHEKKPEGILRVRACQRQTGCTWFEVLSRIGSQSDGSVNGYAICLCSVSSYTGFWLVHKQEAGVHRPGGRAVDAGKVAGAHDAHPRGLFAPSLQASLLPDVRLVSYTLL